jgi:hypothetical protein
MESIFILGALFLLGYWCFRQGKHIGSVKGFNVGRRQRR